MLYFTFTEIKMCLKFMTELKKLLPSTENFARHQGGNLCSKVTSEMFFQNKRRFILGFPLGPSLVQLFQCPVNAALLGHLMLLRL